MCPSFCFSELPSLERRSHKRIHLGMLFAVRRRPRWRELHCKCANSKKIEDRGLSWGKGMGEMKQVTKWDSGTCPIGIDS